MERRRFLKPELFKDENLLEAERHCKLPLRLTLIALFSCCDCEGRFRWQPERLKREIFFGDDVDIVEVLDFLAMTGFIKKYELQGERYGCISNWSEYQYINQLESHSDVSSSKKSIKNDVIVASQQRSSFLMNDLIQQVFEHWKTVMKCPDARLDLKRKNLISAALNLGYKVEQLFQAIEGCYCTPYNMGNNDQGQRYNGLSVIFRDADQIDRFIHHYYHPPKPRRMSDKLTQENRQVLEGWMNRKMQEKKDRLH